MMDLWWDHVLSELDRLFAVCSIGSVYNVRMVSMTSRIRFAHCQEHHETRSFFFQRLSLCRRGPAFCHEDTVPRYRRPVWTPELVQTP